MSPVVDKILNKAVSKIKLLFSSATPLNKTPDFKNMYLPVKAAQHKWGNNFLAKKAFTNKNLLARIA